MSTTNSLYDEHTLKPPVDQTTNGSMSDVVRKILDMADGQDSTRADCTRVTVRIKGR